MRGKGASMAPFPCPPPPNWRLVLRPRGRLSGSPGRDFRHRESRMQQPAGRRPVVDVAFQGGSIPVTEQVDRAKVLRRLRLGDAGFRHLTRAAAITVLVILGGIIVSLIHGSWQALSTFGVGFLFVESWNPVTEKFGAIAPIYGTVVTSFIAMLIAVPVGLFIALFLTELCPIWLRRPIGTAIELLAGIPSIIY